MNPHAPNSSRFWADWSTRDFSQAQESGLLAQTIAVLPVAATEQHGPHLPLKVDSALLDGVISAALPYLAADVPALFLPTQTVGLSPEHTHSPARSRSKPRLRSGCGPTSPRAWPPVV